MSIASRARHQKAPSPNSSTMLHVSTVNHVTVYTRVQRPRLYGKLTNQKPITVAFPPASNKFVMPEKRPSTPRHKTRGAFGAVTDALRKLGLMKRRQTILAKLTPEKATQILSTMPAESATQLIKQHEETTK